MNANLSLRLEQSNRLLMTPQLRTALELLQLPAFELDGYLEQQALENPLLEIADKSLEAPVGVTPHRVRAALRWRNEVESGQAYSKQDLNMEIDCAEASRGIRSAAKLLLESMDRRGFLPKNTVALAKDLKIDFVTLEAAIDVLGSLSLPGLGASTVEECVLLQLKRRGKLTSLAHTIMRKGLYCLLDLERTAVELHVDLKELEELAREIKSCQPYPAQMLDDSPPVFVIPDLHILWNGERLVVSTGYFNECRIRVSDCYTQLMSQGIDSKARQYLREKRSAALWLIRSVQRRNSTLHKVGEVIANYQRGYLLMGVEYLRPLTMLQVAEQAGLHESTVSRAVADKYAITPQGILPLRFFFGSGVKGVAGELAAEAVKKKIAQAIRDEDRSRPLSDAQLVKILAKEGIAISRRTVAKYRNSIGVLSSADRRRYDIMG